MALLDSLNPTSPPEQDFIMLDGVRSPGRATIVNAGIVRTWDKRKGFGYSGATLVYTGDDLSEFDVILDIWDDLQWAEWLPFALMLKKPPVGPPRKQTIGHPILTRDPLKIETVVLTKATQWKRNNETGLWTCTLSFSEYRAPLPAVGKPTPEIPGAGLVVSPPSAFELQMQALLAQANALGGGL